MSGDSPIKTGQTWMARSRGRLKGSGQISVVALGEEDRVQIERSYSTGKVRRRREWITISGLRRRYTLYSEQETLL